VGELEIPSTREKPWRLYAAAGAGALVVAVGAIVLLGPWRNGPAGETRATAPAEGPAPTTADTPPANAAPPAAEHAQAVADAGMQAAPPAAPAPTPQRTGAADATMAPLPMATSLPPDVASPRTPPTGGGTSAAGAHGAGPGMVDANGAGAHAATPRAAAGARNGVGMAPAAGGTGGDRTTSNPAAGATASPTPADAGVEHYGPPLANGAAPAATPPPAAANPVKKLGELPPGVRSQLPNLTVGGAIYSETPSGRMLILNGQIYHEGDKPAADTVLEQIRLKSAVLNWRGQRYEITY
jgi:general secretion pathway protein B